jgi:hypothetical protein
VEIDMSPTTAPRPAVAPALAAAVAAFVAIAVAAVAAAPAATPHRARSAPPACSMSFVAYVRRGPHSGSAYRGVLRMTLDARGRLAGGTLQLLAGRRLRVRRVRNRHEVAFRLVTRAGVLYGSGSVDGRLRPCVGRMTGALRGPGRRDRGDWLAASGQTITLPDGSLYITAPSTHVLYRADNALSAPSRVFAGALNTPGNIDGARLQARMNMPGGIAFDPASSTLYVADVGNATIRRIVLGSGQVTTMLRPSTAAAAAQAAGFPAVTGWEPQGVAVGSGGAVFITDARNYVVWKYSPSTQQLKLLAGRPGTPGNADGNDTAVRFTGPQQISVSPTGLISVVDVISQRFRLRDNGSWSTLATCC